MSENLARTHIAALWARDRQKIFFSESSLELHSAMLQGLHWEKRITYEVIPRTYPIDEM